MSNRKPQAKTATSYVVNLAEVKIPTVNLNQVRLSPKDWVLYGDNNAFPKFLSDSVKKSENHSAFIHLRENMIKGSGLSYSDNVKPFLENLDEEGTTIEELWGEWSADMAVQETFACFVRYNKARTKITAIDYLDTTLVRPSKTFQTDSEGNPNGKISGYWVCEDWSNIMMYPPVFYERFGGEKPTETTQVYFYHKRTSGQPFLPEISYASCLNYVQMEYETSKYGLNAMLNGFFGSAIMSVKASMSDEQKEMFTRNVNHTFTGSENASKLMVIVSEQDDTVKVTPLATGDNTPMLQALSEKSQQAIATAHRGNPSLAGIQVSAGFGSDAALLRTAQEQFQNNVILRLQQPMLTFLKKVMKFNGVAEYDFNVGSLNLVSEITPDFFLQNYVKAEVLAAKYGFKIEDLKPSVLTPEVTPAAPAPVAAQ
ncbi:phage portal protein [Hymenobacter siberiensis]|uniref:phage portal protein n=1 Tax=Hymenobacter siberiensis TaxID=2848396 RepID=UPI001C1E5457|nr:phage portal protein [Hymenobacter siberiensis]